MVRIIRRLFRSKSGLVGFVLISLMCIIATFAPYLAPDDPTKQDLSRSLEPPSWSSIMGRDEFGRDILSRVIFGTRISLFTGFVAVGIGVAIGIPIGAISGFYGGWVDIILQRIIDTLMTFPGILLAIVVITILGIGLEKAMVAVGISSIPVFARLMRASVLAVKEEDFVEASRASGAGNLRILTRHVLINSLSPVLVQASFQFGSSILWAAALSFLGLGAQPPAPEWGAMLASGKTYIFIAPHVITFPGLAIMIAVLGFNLLGEALRDILDPRIPL